jgi:S1-C subfamily serine protease
MASLLWAGTLPAQTPPNVAVKVAVVDAELNVKPVPKFNLTIQLTDADGNPDSTVPPVLVATSFEGAASVSLPPGHYRIVSDKPLTLGDKTFNWDVKFKVEAERPLALELSNDNANTTLAAKRRLSDEAELFQILREGVVTVESDIGSGTGFIVDAGGLIVTNQHVISASQEIRVRFDRKHIVRAVLLAENPARDIAVLWVNPAACVKCKVLPIARPKNGEPIVIEGERVFAIGSPLQQEKILTAGIVSKVEERAIISDININPGNSGGPLFNSLGEVIGITTFGIQGPSGPGISGIVRIEEALGPMERAGTEMRGKQMPSAELMPTLPDDAFPVEAIKAKIDVKKFDTKPYRTGIGDFEIVILTPVHKFYVEEKDRIEAAKDRSKRNEGKGVQIDTVDKYRNLRNWSEYAGQLKPVVEIAALPEVKATGKSMFLNLVMASTVGVMPGLDFKFKADFYQMSLMCDGKEVTPIQRRKEELIVPMPSYLKEKNRYTFAGFYSYPYEVFEPGACKELELRMFSEEKPNQPASKVLQPKTRQRIWDDFADYRQQKTAQ